MEVRRTSDPMAVTTNELKNEAFPCWMRCSRHEALIWLLEESLTVKDLEINMS